MISGQIILWYVLFALFLLISFFVAIRGINSPFFKSLNAPPWAPTFFSAVIISIIVYGLSYVGLYIVYNIVTTMGRSEGISESPSFNPGVMSFIFALNLILVIAGTLWFLTFFSFQGLRTSLFVSAIVLAISLYYTYILYQYSPLGAALQIPFLLWLTVYVFLSASYVELNPNKL